LRTPSRKGRAHFRSCRSISARSNDIPELVRGLRKQFGPLYGLINNAALGLPGTLALMHHSKIEEMVRLNTVSPIVLTKYVLRGMMADGAGRIVNVASIVASTGASGVAAYAVSAPL
jgi:3-oxoacyl-[acyl-carrier protein] reductase